MCAVQISYHLKFINFEYTTNLRLVFYYSSHKNITNNMGIHDILQEFDIEGKKFDEIEFIAACGKCDEQTKNTLEYRSEVFAFRLLKITIVIVTFLKVNFIMVHWPSPRTVLAVKQWNILTEGASLRK